MSAHVNEDLTSEQGHFDTKTPFRTPLQQQVFLDRYARKDPHGVPIEHRPEEMWRRVAKAIAAVEPTAEKQEFWADQFYQAMRDFRFVPGGRILAGAGAGHAITLFNCFVIPSPEDSRGGILDNLKLMTEIMARGGGVGVNLSTLRPRGSYIRTVNGTASGPCSWAQLYSVATGDVIQQGGSRRGALMLMLDDSHPDVEEFVTAKRRPGILEHANLSVCVSDALMEAVRADADWPLVWEGKVQKTLRARDLWNLICESAWASAEPGVVFIDRCNRESNTWYYETIRCVNPCVAGETLVYTTAGLVPIRELVGVQGPVEIVSPSGDTFETRSAQAVFTSGLKQVFRLQTKEGYYLRLTLDHRVLTQQGWKEAGQLQSGDKIRLLSSAGRFGTWGNYDLGLVTGWLIGDGYINHADNQRTMLHFYAQEKRELAPLFRAAVERLVTGSSRREYPVGIVAAGPDRDLVRSARMTRLLDPVLLEDKFQVPPSVFQGKREMQKGFLRALFTADGTVVGTTEKGYSVRLASSHVRLLEGVQQVLLNFGITSRIYRNRRPQQLRALPNGRGGSTEYECSPQHELALSKACFPIFAQEIGFLLASKQETLRNAIDDRSRGFYREAFLATFESLTPEGVKDVYDLSEPIARQFVANGLVVHNCGEEPLPPFGVCNLGSLNLTAFVADGTFDFNALAGHVRIAIRFLDDVIDATPYFLEENRHAQLATRRTGLGTMGLADVLLALGLRYGSDESLAIIERIYATIRDVAYDTSCDLAAEKGSFPRFDPDRYLQGPFVQRLSPALQAKILELGIRNAVLLCQAPSGTTSLLAGVSSGIEPVFDFAMVRRDRLGEHCVYHPLYQAWRQNFPDAPLPSYFVRAADLSPDEHVRVQALIQRYTDASISKTVNAPSTHTPAQVDALYRLAYELGCKGITYYRDGSRDAVLNHVQPQEPTNDHHQGPSVSADEPAHPRVRPPALVGATYRAPTPVGTAFVTINRGDDGDVMELFVTVGRAGSDVAADAEAIGRLISLALRIPSPLPPARVAEAVVDQLQGIGGSSPVGFGSARVRSLADAVAKVLAAALRQTPSRETAAVARPAERDPHPSGDFDVRGETRSRSGNFCPSCGQLALVYEEGCYKCYACGFSSC
jgi:ribonucleoside-diphosphate reductase alpha chain